jgi:hypothetical protein
MYIEEIGGIDIEQRRISEKARTRKKYWHFGTNKTMDHADQIGVFTNEDTVRCENRPFFLVLVQGPVFHRLDLMLIRTLRY